ncbi:hypothetical protein ARMGADRAFT_606642 [Armillaria gallica]|uniref:Uncharacterized protein n=1 Tax=Armillaria gallica TaxID=47427 RepID=A0A2H3DA53_ARMGA|nr:hypothetical protein ARMGADRAFT_606642 [Armillaria gallica]
MMERELSGEYSSRDVTFATGSMVFFDWLPACSPCDQHGIIPWNYVVFPRLFTKRWLRHTFQHQFISMSMHACVRFKEYFIDISHQSPPPHLAPILGPSVPTWP